MIVNSNVKYVYYTDLQGNKHINQHYSKIAVNGLKIILGNLPKTAYGKFIGTEKESAFINCGFTPKVVWIYTRDGMTGQDYGGYGGMGLFGETLIILTILGAIYNYKMIEIVENGFVVFYYQKIQNSSYYVGLIMGQNII